MAALVLAPQSGQMRNVAIGTTAIDPRAVAAIPLPPRECGCPQGQRCDCTPRLRIFDPMGRLLLSPVYY